MRAKLGEMLQAEGAIRALDVDLALAFQQRWGVRFGDALVRLNVLSEDQVLAAIGRQLRVPAVRIGDRVVPPEVLRRVPERLVRRHRALPLEVVREHGAARLVVAFATPDDLWAVDEIAFAAGASVRPVLAAEEDLDRAIARHLNAAARAMSPAGPVEVGPAPTSPMRLVG